MKFFSWSNSVLFSYCLIVECSGSNVMWNNALCDAQLQATLVGLTDKDPWALEFFDAWGNWPSGQFSGNQYDFGNYDQCRSYYYDHLEVGAIRGRYCMVVLPRQSDNLTKRFFVDMEGINGVGIGSCFPNTCSEEHLYQPMKKLIELRYNIVANDSIIYCDNEFFPLGGTGVAAITVISLIAAVVVVSTIYEVYAILSAREPSTNLTTFSVYSNWMWVMKVTKTKHVHASKTQIIECLHGIRVMAIIWIIYGHTYLLMLSAPLINPVATIDWIFYSALVVAGPISVDTFFVLSGLLTCWSLLRELDRNKKLNVFLLYVHRYLRLTPAFAALLLFIVGLYPRLGAGPLWGSSLKITVDFCNKYWWSALLYVQNYVNPNEMCLGHSWYLSVDMQLFLLSPLVVYPLWRWGRRVLIVVAALILSSIGCIFGVTLQHDLRANIMLTSLERDRYSYVPTHTRMGAWFVGLVLGYILHCTKDRIVQLSKSKLVLGWTLSLVLIVVCIFGAYPLNQPDFEKHPVIADALYESTKHVLWALSVGWIIFACSNGYGGPINKILCLSIWQPLGKLSYCMYLLHLPIQLMITSSMRTVRHFSDLHTIHTFWGDIAFTILVSLIWTLCFEAPFGNLDRLLLRSYKKSSSRR
ncbi:nose resistant to fluoxetine protein 6-like [Topomyia yanbarensis]|uniref:nose resistant to fluoxetine protein 6-like n=1 Tax=Topomyia yanbarensis TaxID=2498891 RepID=UPI00273A978C|nr:nose resistant to fluoxetine protein 6-like [Topomyia yanbarensis]